MPLYEYQCDNCGARFERIQKFSDPPIQTCPTCGGPVHKLISSPAIQFKGTGWYITDYAKSGKSGDTSSSKKQEGDSGKTESASKSDAETAAKTDAKTEPKTDSSTSSKTSSPKPGGSSESS